MLLPGIQPRIEDAILQGRGAEPLLKNDAINLFNGANMADPKPKSGSRRTIFLVSISIALCSIFLSFYTPNIFRQQHNMSTIKNVAVIGVRKLPIDDGSTANRL